MPSERVQRRIDVLLDQIEAAETSDDWGAVRELASRVLDLDPGNEDARAFLEAVDRREGRLQAHSGLETQPSAPSAPPLPASFASGRYEARSFLGEGARKRVYLAHDTRLGRDVAVSVIKTEGLDLVGRERVQREAQAMARLGDHPNIVTVHDVAEDKGDPILVSQYMGGGSVEDLIAAAEDHRPPVADTLRIAAEVCAALEFAHRQGIVHRDLKPGNVWLTADGTAKLGDFGLAVALDRSRMTMQGMLLGTVAYMPPEQALGGESTPQADLYSLGCMLYEMVTGRPPFLGDDPTAVISQHINTPPVAPSWLTEHCPPELEEVVLHLLAKAPADRPASAAEVAAVLAKVDPERASPSHSGSSENPLDRLARGVFVGRTKELERLRKAFDEAFAGHGGLVMLVGEPGIGKTRTTEELETYARMRGAQVLWGRTHESGGAPAYWPWLQIGNQWAASGNGANLNLSVESIGELSRIFPALRQQPGFVEPRQWDDLELAQFRLFDAYAGFLQGLATQAPLLVALDDLHWADKPTLQLLQHVAREVGRSRILIAGNYRDTDITRQSALSETLAVLNRESGFVRIVLRGLSRDEVAAYIKAKANVEPGREVLDRIYEETEGNAFFLSEVVNLMAEEGTLGKDSVSDIAVPDGVREALGRRLNRLSPETNSLLQLAAVIGREFTFDTLGLLREEDEDALLKLVEEALDARVIEEMPQAGRYRFTHAQMQETLLEELSTTRRVRLHGQVAEALEKRWGGRAEQYAARLAEHYVEASTLTPRHAGKALHYSRLAGEEALARLAWPEAAAHYEAALEQVEAAGGLPPLDEAALHEGLSRTLLAMGRRERDGFREAAFAFRAYADATDSAAAFRVADFIAVCGLQGPRVEGLLAEAISLQAEGSSERGFLECDLGFRLGARGEYGETLRRLDIASEIASATANRILENRALAARAQAHDFNGHSGLDDHVQAAAMADELGDINLSASSHSMAVIGYLAHELDLERAAEHAAKARASAESTRLSSRIVTAAYVQSLLPWYLGDFVHREPLDRALALGSLDPRPVGVRLWYALCTGDDAEAMAAIETFDQLGQELQGTARQGSGFLTWAPLSYALWWWQTCSERCLTLATQLCTEHQAGPNTAVGSSRLLEPTRGLVAIASGDLGRIAAWYEEPPPGDSWRRSGIPPLELVKGLAAEALGRREEALEKYEAAIDVYRLALPSWVMLAFERARLLVELGRRDAAAAIDEVLAVTTRIGMNRWRDKAIALKVRLQGIGAGSRSIDTLAATVQSEHPEVAVAAPDGRVTIFVSDIEDSTALNERLGDERWLELLREHNEIVRRHIHTHGGHEVKTIGDAFMVVFADPLPALRCAAAAQEEFAGREREPRIRIRVGLHTGGAVRLEDDFYGTNVTTAFRITALGEGGQVLVSSTLRELAADGEFAFDEGREVELKGLAGKHRVHALRRK